MKVTALPFAGHPLFSGEGCESAVGKVIAAISVIHHTHPVGEAVRHTNMKLMFAKTRRGRKAMMVLALGSMRTGKARTVLIAVGADV